MFCRFNRCACPQRVSQLTARSKTRYVFRTKGVLNGPFDNSRTGLFTAQHPLGLLRSNCAHCYLISTINSTPSYKGQLFFGVVRTCARLATIVDYPGYCKVVACPSVFFVASFCPTHPPEHCSISFLALRAWCRGCLQTFLSVRRVRLIEDLILLSLSLGDNEDVDRSKRHRPAENALNNRGGNYDVDDRCKSIPAGLSSVLPTALSAVKPTGPLSTLAALRRELADAREQLPPNPASFTGPANRHADSSNNTATHVSSSRNSPTATTTDDLETSMASVVTAPAVGRPKARGVSLTDGSIAEKVLQGAAGVSVDVFFSTWAERFGTLLVSLGGGRRGEGEGDRCARSGRGGSKKDDR